LYPHPPLSHIKRPYSPLPIQLILAHGHTNNFDVLLLGLLAFTLAFVRLGHDIEIKFVVVVVVDKNE
jgi:hypothetical protein